MKLTKIKNRNFSLLTSWKGRYKLFEVNIREGCNNMWGTPKADYYYVVLDSSKYSKLYNSLWDEQRFETKEAAEEYAIKWIDNFIKQK